MTKIRSVLIVCMLLTTAAKSQHATFQPSFAALVVADIDSSISWYSRVLHLTLRNRADNSERGFKQAVLISQGFMLELVELSKSISPDSLLQTQVPGTRLMGYYKFGFTVPHIDQLFQRFADMSLTFHGRMVTDPENNKKTFIIKDPDNNRVQFFEE